jgi:hypothetical protein
MHDLSALMAEWESGTLELRKAETLISLLIIDNKWLDGPTTTNQARKGIASKTIRNLIEDAHMAGQADSGTDPGYSDAQRYCDDLFDA